MRFPGDELAAFAAEEPAFLAVDVNDAEGPSRAIAHVRRQWTTTELRRPRAFVAGGGAAGGRFRAIAGRRPEAIALNRPRGGRSSGSEGTDVG